GVGAGVGDGHFGLLCYERVRSTDLLSESTRTSADMRTWSTRRSSRPAWAARMASAPPTTPTLSAVMARLVSPGVAAAGPGGPHGLGAADDLHDLGGDGVLAGPVHGPAVLDDQVLGIVGGRLHRPLLGGEERGRALEEGGVQPRLGVARQQALEDLGGVGLELVVALGPVGGLLEHRAVEGHEPADD